MRQRIIRAQRAINASIRVAASFKAFLKELEVIGHGVTDVSLLAELDTYICKLESHRASFEGLLLVSKGTMTLVTFHNPIQILVNSY